MKKLNVYKMNKQPKNKKQTEEMIFHPRYSRPDTDRISGYVGT